MHPPLFAAILLGLCPTATLAGVTGTLSAAPSGEDVVSYNTWQATSFQLAAGAGSYRVRDVRLHLTQVVPNANLLLRITGSIDGRPDNTDVRINFRNPAALPSTPGVTAFAAAPVPDPLLLPGQTYWLSLGVAALDNEQALPGGLYRWSYAATAATDSPSAAGWSVSCCTASSGTAGSAWTAAVNTPYLFSISARPPVFLPPSSPVISWQGASPVLTARGTPGVEYNIDASTNLTDWTTAGTSFADAAGIIHFTDAALLPRRFYRFQ